MIRIFKPTKKFKKDYDKLYKSNPTGANVLLLLCELADNKGIVKTNEDELYQLFLTRFNDPDEYAFGEDGIYHERG